MRAQSIFKQIWSLIFRFSATNPRDLIYSFLGITDSEVEVDYSKSEDRIFSEFALQWIKWSQRINRKTFLFSPLLLAGLGNRNSTIKDLPSWAPDLSAIKTPGSYGSWIESLTLYRPAGKFNRRPMSFVSVDNGVLKLRGIQEASIINVWPSTSFDNNPERWMSSVVDVLLPAYKSLEHPTKRHILDVIFRTVLCDHGLEDHSHHRLVLGMVQVSYEREWVNSFVHDITHSKVEDFRAVGLNEESIRILVETQRGIPMVNQKRQQFVDFESPKSYWNAYKHGSNKKPAYYIQTRRILLRDRSSFFQTLHGYLGLGPPNLQVGDIICIFAGISLPLILRSQGTHYQLVGSCFIYGLMDGESVFCDTGAWERSLTEFEIW
jgi:hypothetical protein